ncbi:hypothetical protein LPB136_00865 [Tenacibaculum todarodis]|uniref:Uncharacterized protein n=1 Tax=Tenacibaculum todarodis TaxID=1850252 RepID=A0A1L3JFU7_9FLAO|nr:hypothetical protein [Tenacibaculum todarodis]APG64006.1 hypothetical protein LPB136_00865 [Tenacibaculum todarodis]
MKKLTLILICISAFYCCKSDPKAKSTGSLIEELENKKQKMIDKASKNIELLDCKDYFKKADYSTICFIESENPNYTVVSSNNMGCTFRFAKVDNFDEYLDISITTYKNKKDADAMYNIFLLEMSDTIDSIKNLGDLAGLEKTDKVSSNRSLYIKHNNSFIQIQANRVVGTRATPCFFSKDEIIKFAKLFISEL